MKKFIYIFSLILFLVSCVREQMPVPAPQPEDGKVTVNFSVVVPDAQMATKGMGEKPLLRNLYLAVFDEVGYLAEYIKADPEKTEYADNNNVIYKYSVTLSLSDTPRTIHWIGNAPESVMYGSEENVMMGLKTSGNEDTYWYRKVVSKVDAVPIAEGVTASEELIAALSNIPLIRNFAKIVLVNNDVDFKLLEYTVVNILDEAYTVAYDFGNGRFVDYMKEEAEGLVSKTYDELIEEGYNASVPTFTSYVSLETAMTNKIEIGESQSATYYVYEREKPLSTPAYILAKGRYCVNKSTNHYHEGYYKINLRDDNGEYFPLLRNFQYTVNIKAVYRQGYDTPQEAAASTGSGDISTALETETLNYMSDGVASLEVSFSDIVVMTKDPIALNLKFYPNLFDDATLYKGAETKFQESVKVFINEDAGISGKSVASVSEIDYTGETPVVYITPTDPGDNPKSQTITVLATYTPDGSETRRTIQRKVKITVMNPQLMTAQCVPYEVPKLMGTAFGLDVTIPAGLSQGMFPLDFKIESKNLSITPNLNLNQMNIETGKSIINNIKPSYFFTRNLTWAEYQSLANVEGKKTFSAYFKTTTSASETDIYVANDYFYGSVVEDKRISYASTYLKNYVPLYFKTLKFNPSPVPAGVDEKVEFSFGINDIPDDGKVILAMANVAPDENEDKLKLKDVVDGVAHYEYTATSTGTHKFQLITISADGQPKITLSAYHFMEESLIATRGN